MPYLGTTSISYNGPRKLEEAAAAPAKAQEAAAKDASEAKAPAGAAKDASFSVTVPYLGTTSVEWHNN